jgi:hypothetical protein
MLENQHALSLVKTLILNSSWNLHGGVFFWSSNEFISLICGYRVMESCQENLSNKEERLGNEVQVSDMHKAF